MTSPKAGAPKAGKMPLVSVRDQRANFDITDLALGRLVSREIGEFTHTLGVSIDVNQSRQRATPLVHYGDRAVEQIAQWLNLDEVTLDAVSATLYTFMVRLCEPGYRQYWRDLRLHWRGRDFTYYYGRDFLAFGSRADHPIRLAHDRTHARVYDVLPAFSPATVDLAHLAWPDHAFFACPLEALAQIPDSVPTRAFHILGTPESPGYDTPSHGKEERDE